VYDIIRLERPQWMEGNAIGGTLFVDGEPWEGSPEVLRDRLGSEVEEIIRMERAPGAYEGYGVVVEVITRGEVWR
jgi:hypothetical protein